MDNQQPSFEFRPLKENSDYLIYEDGRLYSKKVNRFLKGKIDNSGYRVYALAINDKLSSNGKRLSKMCYAHRLVATYFIPNPDNLPMVNHKDENKLNNHYSNLEWVTAKENTNYSLKKRKVKPATYFDTSLEGEEWKVFPENLNYSISSMGRVKNNRTNRILHIDSSQTYNRVSLQVNKKSVHYYVHRLVYCVFYNDFDLDGFVIDHIDANPKNNNLTNLQKITQSENCLKQRRFND